MEKPNLKMLCALELENQKEKNWLFAVWILLYVVLWQGEKIARGIDHAIKTECLCDDFKIRWRRMMEAAYSLMQLAKTSVKLAQLAEAKLPYIYVQTQQLRNIRFTRCWATSTFLNQAH
jgi:hypothetical protein